MASDVKRAINLASGLSSRGARVRESNKIKKWTKNFYKRKSQGGSGG